MTEPADAALRALRFELPGGGHALFTTRADGNLSTMRGPGHERGRRERDRLCEELGVRGCAPAARCTAPPCSA